MERMRSMYDAELNRRHDVANPLGEGTVSLGESDRTIPQIRDNPQLHDLFFGSHIFAQDPVMSQEIILALEKNPTVLWTPAQNAFLEQSRQSFNRQMTLASIAREALSDQEVLRMAGRDPRIQEILGRTNNLAEAGAVLRSQLNRVAIQETARFEQIVNNLRAARTLDSSDAAQQVAARVNERLERYSLTQEQFQNAMRSSMNTDNLTDQTRTQLAAAVREQMSGAANVLNFFSFGLLGRSKVRDMVGAASAEHAMFQQRQAHMQQIGNLLHATLDPDMLVAIQTALRDGGRPEIRDERTVKSLPDYRGVREAAKTEHTPEARSNRFKDQLRAESLRLKKRPTDFTSAEQSAFNNSFIGGEEQTHQANKATGLFAALVKMLFPSRTDMEGETANWWSSMRGPATP